MASPSTTVRNALGARDDVERATGDDRLETRDLTLPDEEPLLDDGLVDQAADQLANRCIVLQPLLDLERPGYDALRIAGGDRVAELLRPGGELGKRLAVDRPGGLGHRIALHPLDVRREAVDQLRETVRGTPHRPEVLLVRCGGKVGAGLLDLAVGRPERDRRND